MCPHRDKKHYAKNMCHNCYHRKGKTKMATECEHTDKPHYSNGKCQSCYLAEYYIKRKKVPKAGSKRAHGEHASAQMDPEDELECVKSKGEKPPLVESPLDDPEVDQPFPSGQKASSQDHVKDQDD